MNPYGLPPEVLALAVPAEEVEEMRAMIDFADVIEESRASMPLSGGPLPDLLDAFVNDYLTHDEHATRPEEVEAFLLQLARLGKTIQAEVAALEAEQQQLAARVQRRRDRLAELRAWLRACMEGHGVQRVKDARVTLWLAQNSQPSIRPADEGFLDVPAAYLRATLVMARDQVPEGYEGDIAKVDLDRAKVLATLKETGEIVAGVEVERGAHISWR